MAIDLTKIKRGLNLSTLKLVIYGEEKIGKSTFCSQMPNPIFIDIEGGTNFLDTTRITEDDISVDGKKTVWSYDSVMGVLDDLLVQDHEYKTLVIDSIDWLESLIMTKVAIDNCGRSYLDSKVKALSYGGGTAFLAQHIREFMQKIKQINESKKMHIVFIAHTKKRSDTDMDDGSSFDKQVLKLTEKVEAVVIEWADFVLFAHNKPIVQKVGESNVAIGSERQIRTAKHASFSGGVRLAIAESFPLHYDHFQAELHNAIKKLKAESAAREIPVIESKEKPVNQQSEIED